MKVLAIDGGGILGIAPATWLDMHPEEAVADLYCGTSTGAIIASCLAFGFTPKYIFDLYQELGRKVFADNRFDNIRDLGCLIGARYSHKNLKEALKDVFGDYRMGDLTKSLLVPAFDLVNYKTKVWTNTRKDDDDLDQKIVDVVGASCSAPTYFPTWNRYIDGGVSANNPSMCGICEAIICGHKLSDIDLLSLSSYETRQSVGRDVVQDWGFAQWAQHLPAIAFDAPSDAVDFQCRQILGKSYRRVNFTGDKAYGLDCLEALRALPSFVRNAKMEAC